MQLEENIAKELAAIVRSEMAMCIAECKRLIAEMPKPERGERGEVGPQGPPGIDGKDGRDGINGIDGKDGAGPSRGRYRGPWKHDAEYALDDMVSYDNSGWVAIVEKPMSRPGNGSKDWQLFVRKGRDGKDGERGPQGPAGPPGKASY